MEGEERNHIREKAVKVCRVGEGFRSSKGIHHSHKGSPLSREILESQKGDSGKVRRPHRSFNLLAVAPLCQNAGGAVKRAVIPLHSMLFKGPLITLKIARFQDPLVVSDPGIIGITLKLPHFKADGRHLHILQFSGIGVILPRLFVIDKPVIACKRTAPDPVIVLLRHHKVRIRIDAVSSVPGVGAFRIEPCRIKGAHLLAEFPHPRPVFTAQLVSPGHRHKGRVVCICTGDAFRLPGVVVICAILFKRVEGPLAQLRLQVDSKAVGTGEGGLRRA